MCVPQHYFVSQHALERYREHHLTATVEDVENACLNGEEISPELVASLCGRVNRDNFSSYIVGPEQRGILVVNRSERVIITYLRLGDIQRRILQGEVVIKAPQTKAERHAEKERKEQEAAKLRREAKQRKLEEERAARLDLEMQQYAEWAKSFNEK